MKGMVKLNLVYQNAAEILNKLKSIGFQASSLSTYCSIQLYAIRTSQRHYDVTLLTSLLIT